jgi:hypothetical protein
MSAVLRSHDTEEDRQEFLRACLEINPTDLNQEFIKVPGEIAHWNEQFANATYAHATAKLTYEREYARLFVELRNTLDPNTKKPPSLELLKAMCDADEDLGELAHDMNLKDADRIHIRGLVDAVVRKADMLQSLGAKIREEHRGDAGLRRERAENALVGR